MAGHLHGQTAAPIDFAFTHHLSPELRAKYTMLIQSTLALALFGLVVARAVNALK